MSRILAWMCLVLVASVTALGLELTAAAMTPSTAAGQTSGRYEAAFTPLLHDVVIIGVDATTEDRKQLVCAAPSDRVASDALVVDLKDLGDVAAHICNVSATPVMRSGQPW